MKKNQAMRLLTILLIALIVTVPSFTRSTGRSTVTNATLAKPGGQRVVHPLVSSDFSIASTPVDFAVPRGSQGTSSIILNSLGGFSSAISLTAATTPSGLSVSLSPSSVTPTAGCSCSSVLTVSPSITLASGLYNVNVTGTSGSLSHSAILQVAVTPITWSISDNENFTGVNVRTTGTFSIDSPSNVLTVSGTATVTATNATTHSSLFSQTDKINKEPLNYPYQSGLLAKFILNIAVNPYPLGLHLNLELPGPTSTTPGSPEVYMFVYRNADINGDGFVTLWDFNTAVASFNCSTGMQCYNPRADLNGDGTVDIIDVSVVDYFFPDINYGVSSYNVSSSTSMLTVIAGGWSTATLTLDSVSGYSGTVSLATKVSSSGIAASVNPTSVTLTSGGSSQSVLTVSATATGFYTVTVNATAGNRMHVITLGVDVVDFTLSASPSDFSVHNGNSGSSTITVTPLNGFAGTVSLSASILPSTGPTVSVSPSSITVSGCGSTSTVTVNARGTTGLYNVNVTGTSGGISHSVIVQVATAPLSWTIALNANFTGVNVKANGTLSLDYPTNTISVSGSLNVVAANASTHVSLFSKTYTISHLVFSYPYAGGYQSLFLANVAVSPYALATYIILQLSAPTSSAPGAPSVPTSFVARNADINADGVVDLTDFNAVANDFNCSIGQQCYNPRADLDASGIVDIIDVGIADRYFGSTNYI